VLTTERWNGGSCPDCRDTPIKVAHNTGDGWVWHWCCYYGCGWCEELPSVLPWPFDGDTAKAEDFERAGYEVVR